MSLKRTCPSQPLWPPDPATQLARAAFSVKNRNESLDNSTNSVACQNVELARGRRRRNIRRRRRSIKRRKVRKLTIRRQPYFSDIGRKKEKRIRKRKKNVLVREKSVELARENLSYWGGIYLFILVGFTGKNLVAGQNVELARVVKISRVDLTRGYCIYNETRFLEYRTAWEPRKNAAKLKFLFFSLAFLYCTEFF